MTDRNRHEHWFKKRLGYWPNKHDPQSLADYLYLWRMREPDELTYRLTDKSAAKKYVSYSSQARAIPSVYEGNDYKPTRFPFIAKPNNKCQATRLIRNRSDWGRFETEWLKIKDKDYGRSKNEWNYWGIEPLYIIEPVIESAREFKVYCFSGEPKLVWMLSPRPKMDSYKVSKLSSDGVTFFWADGSLAPAKKKGVPRAETTPPKYFNRVVECAASLSKGLPFVRVDLLMSRGVIYFCEYTFCPGGGHVQYDPPEFDFELGKFVKEPL